MRLLRPFWHSLRALPCFALLGLALDVLSEAQGLEHLAALCAGEAPVGIDIVTGVVLIEHVIKVRAVVLAGLAGGDLADELVFDVHADAQLVAVVALAMFLGMGGIQVFLSALGLVPVAGDIAQLKLGLSSLVKCWMGAGTSVASMICPHRAR
jgi:hypothetical protein